ncbi:hypothetical protein [Nostoc sp. FACHB-133]|nr:hypothetical protein [Nostoc sp. FACHB-133]
MSMTGCDALSVGAASRREAMPQALRYAIGVALSRYPLYLIIT